MTPEEAKQRLAGFAQQVGREVKVFVWEAALRRDEAEVSAEADRGAKPAQEGPAAPEAQAQSQPQRGDEGDDFYEFTAADYARLVSSRKEERFLKLRKHREQELQERRSRITKAVIRVIFPDGFVVESTFSPSDTVADVRALIKQCLRAPDSPFYFFTVPPKRRIKDEAMDLYTAQLAPGALIHFAPEEGPTTVRDKGSEKEGTEGESRWLAACVSDLKNLHVVADAPKDGKISEPELEQAKHVEPPRHQASASEQKKVGVPKWFKR